jgi:hypothetical protein
MRAWPRSSSISPRGSSEGREQHLLRADVAVTLELEDGALPIPSVSWHSDG